MRLLIIILLLLPSCARYERYKICPNTIDFEAKTIPYPKIDLINVPPQYLQCIIKATDVWNDALRKKLVSIGPDGNIQVYWFQKRPLDFRKEEEARTTAKWLGSLIKIALVRVNDFDFNYSIDFPSEGQIDCESLMIHELGHALGLGHNAKYSSVMYPSLFIGQIRRRLSNDDLNTLQCLYQ